MWSDLKFVGLKLGLIEIFAFEGLLTIKARCMTWHRKQELVFFFIAF